MNFQVSCVWVTMLLMVMLKRIVRAMALWSTSTRTMGDHMLLACSFLFGILMLVSLFILVALSDNSRLSRVWWMPLACLVMSIGCFAGWWLEW